MLLPTRNRKSTAAHVQGVHDGPGPAPKTAQRRAAWWGPYHTGPRPVGRGRPGHGIPNEQSSETVRVGLEAPKEVAGTDVPSVGPEALQRARGLSVVFPELPAASVRARYHYVNQDNVCAGEQNGVAVFALFDGHGPSAEELSGDLLPRLLLDQILTQGVDPKSALVNVDEALKVQSTRSFHNGSTVTGAVVGPSGLSVFNLGDSRTAVIDDSGAVLFVSEEHQPTSRGETERIVRAGGFVEAGRINGSIAVSRALGDHRYKLTDPPLMTTEADVTKIDISGKRVVYVVVMSDGMWVSHSFADVIAEVSRVIAALSPGATTPAELHLTGACLVDAFADGLDDCTVAIARVNISAD